MSKALEILATANNSSDAIYKAKNDSLNIDQDWENESSIYTFDDGSVIVDTNGFLSAYKDAVYPMYQMKLKAEKATSSILCEPEFMTYVSKSSWNDMQDSDRIHFDTYERKGKTCAIKVVLV